MHDRYTAQRKEVYTPGHVEVVVVPGHGKSLVTKAPVLAVFQGERKRGGDDRIAQTHVVARLVRADSSRLSSAWPVGVSKNIKHVSAFGWYWCECRRPFEASQGYMGKHPFLF